MTVSKALELLGEGPSLQDAILEAVDRAQLTLEGTTSFEVVDITGTLTDEGPIFRVHVRVWFTILDTMHG